MKYTLLILIPLLLFCCKTENNNHKTYQNQIGDTTYNEKLDDANFKFCDSANVLHKRAFVKYKEGLKAFEKEVLEKYTYKPIYKNFSGYFIIRFAVNCNNEAGRFRMQILNPEFNLIECSKDLKEDILSIVKSCKKWQHPIYDGKHYDGYTFVTIKIINGKIDFK